MFYEEMGNRSCRVEGWRGCCGWGCTAEAGFKNTLHTLRGSWGCVLGVWKSANTLAPGGTLIYIHSTIKRWGVGGRGREGVKMLVYLASDVTVTLSWKSHGTSEDYKLITCPSLFLPHYPCDSLARSGRGGESRCALRLQSPLALFFKGLITLIWRKEPHQLMAS